MSRQFVDEEFKNSTSDERKRELQQFMKTTIDAYDHDAVLVPEDSEAFLEEYKLMKEVEYVGDSDQLRLAREVVVELDRTYNLFVNEQDYNEKATLLEGLLVTYVKNYLNSNGVDFKEINSSLEWTGDSSAKLKLSLNIGGEWVLQDYEHDYLSRSENESCYEDAPSSWTWAAWLLSPVSPIEKDSPWDLDAMREAYMKVSMFQALDQFVNTLDESTYYLEIMDKINKK